MKKISKQIVLSSLFCGLLATTACDKDKSEKIPDGAFDGTITVMVENGSNYDSIISKVRVMTYNDATELWDKEIAFGNYTNGGFTLTLPTTIDTELLHNLGSFSRHLSVSDRNVRLFGINGSKFYAYNSDDNRIGNFYIVNVDINPVGEVEFTYADRDVTIVGSYLNYIYNVSLKKGWNRVHSITNGDQTKFTTKIVNKEKWSFIYWGTAHVPH